MIRKPIPEKVELEKSKPENPTYCKRIGNSTTLNKGGYHKTAAVSYTIEHAISNGVKGDEVQGTENGVYSDLTISDCNRSITLAFSVYDDEKTGENELHKIRTLIEILEEFESNFSQLLRERGEATKILKEKYKAKAFTKSTTFDDYFSKLDQYIESEKKEKEEKETDTPIKIGNDK